MIRLSEKIPKSEKLRRIDEIVDVLCLRKCLNTGKCRCCVKQLQSTTWSLLLSAHETVE